METNENETTTVHSFWDVAKDILRGKFITIQVFLKKQNKQTNKQTQKQKTKKTLN